MTTLDQIAERAGVTRDDHVYFENKEHLFITMVRELMEVTLDTVQEMLERHQGSTAATSCESSSASSTNTLSKIAGGAKWRAF